jgi:diguanylate cyclase (GGDEF)-like protein
METKLYFRMLQRGWWMILLTASVALTVSLIISYLAVPQYQAIGRFIITPGGTQDIVASLNTLDRRSVVATYAEVMNSNRIKTTSWDAIQRPAEAALQDYAVLAVVLPDANVLELTVTGPDPQIVKEFADVIGRQTILFSRGLNMSFEMNFLDTASLPVEPFSPQPVRDAGVAIMLGMIVGIALVFIREQILIPLDAYRQKLRLDSDTGVHNNRYFRQLVNDELMKDPDTELSVGIIELRGLRDLLETLPPSGLQFLLQIVTKTLRRELRGNDIIARWNDISFSVMLPTTPSQPARRTCERICQALSEEIVLQAYDATINLEPYIGGAVYSKGISVQELFAKAESSLEQAKTSVENPVFLWEMNSPFWVQIDA